MKKILKITLSMVMAVVCLFSFTGCKKKVSLTTTDAAKTVLNGVQTNGGITAVYDGYLYFINGTRENDGTKLTNTTRSAIYRVQYNADGTLGTDYEVVVDDLVGYTNGSLYFFGDYMYYATPCADKNKKATVLNGKTSFMRYDLVNKKTHEVYTTNLNDTKEVLSYEYYVVGTELHLVVFETNNKTITSVKVDKKPTVNYVISDVTACVLSENNGTVVTKDATADANSFVFYSKAHESVEQDKVQTGNKVYKTSPSYDSSTVLYDGGETISILSIRNGKLIYANGSKLYAQTFTGAEKESLVLDNAYVITQNYSTDSSYMFLENADGTISVLYYDATSYGLNIITWKNGELETVNLHTFTKDDKLEFLTTVTLTETEEVEEGETAKSHEVTYLIFINSTKLYKIEIAFDGNYEDSAYASGVIQITSTVVNSATGCLMPEVIGNNLYIFAKNSDDNPYLYKVDVTKDIKEIEKDEDKKATFVGVVDDTDEKKKEEEK